jgi:6-phosphogluconolactonase
MMAEVGINANTTLIECENLSAPATLHQLMSLPLPCLLKSQQIIIHISGACKREVLQAAQAGDDITELPIRAILNQQVAPLSIFWAK